MAIKKFKSKQNDNQGQRFPDKISGMIGDTIIIDSILYDENKFGNMALITYRMDEDGETRTAQTNSGVIIKQLQEEIGDDLPIKVKITSGGSGNRTYYYLSEPD